MAAPPRTETTESPPSPGVRGQVSFWIGCAMWRQRHPTGNLDRPVMLAIVGTTVLVDLLLASATYRWIERPARAWLRRKFAVQTQTVARESTSMV